jgi:hypothetical protein
MKRLPVVLLILFAFFAVSCTTTEKSTAKKTNATITTATVVKPVVIDDQYHGMKTIPDWVFKSQGDIQDQPEFKDFFVFKEVKQGKDINALTEWVNDFSVASEIGGMVSKRIEAKFAGAMVGSVDGADTYFEKVVKTLSKATISGVKKKDNFWLYLRYTNADGSTKDVYEYYLIVLVPQAEMKKAVTGAIDQNPPKTANETRAEEKVKEIMDKDEDW